MGVRGESLQKAALVAQRSARAQVSHLCRSCCGTWREWDQEKDMHESIARERHSLTHDVSLFALTLCVIVCIYAFCVTTQPRSPASASVTDSSASVLGGMPASKLPRCPVPGRTDSMNARM